ncbi:hypothetical protein MMC25_000120 [Agyrium rufum]|nr:hypothetical protein [Agyrium rufum]
MSIQFSPDVITPVRSTSGVGIGGVYSTRNVSRVSSLVEKKSLKEQEIVDIEEGGTLNNRQEDDLKHKQVFSGKLLFWLAYQATGVIYGDIGTSPLYVYSSTFSSPPSYDDLVGALSLIIWTLTLIVTVKYVFIVLRADDEGEGGTFAVYSLLSRYANIIQRDPKEESMIKMERYHTNDLKTSNKTVRNGMEKSRIFQGALKFVGVLGVALIMSDGVLTPAQSVLGAIQGLEVIDSTITSSTIIGVSCAILILLFLIQPLGTTKIATTFAPIVIIWLGFNAAFGIYNLVVFDASVLKAFSPYFAGHYLATLKEQGWRSLGGILLAFTGVEALFADLGAFSRRAIQLSWLCLTFPCLLLAYIGQAAYISSNPSAYSNPFFDSVPPGMFYPSLVIAILAAVVASQAIITGTFQLLSQIMKLSYFPQIKLVHTSKTFHGQIYIPFANWLMMVGTVIVTAVYSNTTRLGNAYGVCVILVTFLTTCMIALVALIVWRLNPILVFAVWLVFAALDGAYLSSVLTKVPDGAWFTLALAFVLSAIFILWRFGKEQQWHAEAADRFNPSHLVAKGEDGRLHLTPAFGGSEISSLKGFGIFFDKIGSMTPMIFIQFLSKFLAKPEVMVFFHLRPLPTPAVDPERRYTVERTVIPGCYRLIIRHGYTDEVISENLGALVYEQIRNFLIHDYAVKGRQDPVHAATQDLSQSEKTEAEDVDNSTSSSEDKKDQAKVNIADPAMLGAKLRELEAAYNHQVLYIVGKEQMRISESSGIWRRITLNAFLWLRDNTRSKLAGMKIPTDQLVEIGFIKEV